MPISEHALVSKHVVRLLVYTYGYRPVTSSESEISVGYEKGAHLVEATADIQGLAILLTGGQRTLRNLATFGEDPSGGAGGALLVEVSLARLSLLEPVLQAPDKCLFLWW